MILNRIKASIEVLPSSLLVIWVLSFYFKIICPKYCDHVIEFLFEGVVSERNLSKGIIEMDFHLELNQLLSLQIWLTTYHLVLQLGHQSPDKEIITPVRRVPKYLGVLLRLKHVDIIFLRLFDLIWLCVWRFLSLFIVNWSHRLR